VTVSTPTRERILDAAIDLFGERGFKGTSVADIEAAAGLSPGAGGMFHHFRSKQAVLDAGIERHLARLGALRDIRRIVGDIGDVRSHLTIMARYVLAELDSESALLRLLVIEARQRPELSAVVDQLVTSSFADFTGWIRDHSALTKDQAHTVAAIGLGVLLSSRLTSTMLGTPAYPISDEALVAGWVHTILLLLENPPA
jgi:AcrR family transcriptional regulator